MKKLILKTAFITLGATFVVLVAVFGLMSLWAPAVMMDLTASLGMNSISGDYAYQEYERSGDVAYLARSFIVAAAAKDDRTADKRFELLFEREDFDEFCSEQENITLTEGITGDYRSYVCGLGVCVKYRLADTDEEKKEICTFAIAETDASFPKGNPVVALATEAAASGDGAFCRQFFDMLYEADFEMRPENPGDYFYIMQILMEVADE